MFSPLNSLKIRDQILLLTIPPLLALAAAVGLLFYVYYRVSYDTFSVEKRQQTVVHTEALLRYAAEMRLEAQNYIVSGQPAALGRYQAANNNVRQEIAALRALAASDPSHVDRWEALEAEITGWQKEWAAPLIAHPERDDRPAMAAFLERGDPRFLSIQHSLLAMLEESQAATSAGIAVRQRRMQQMLVGGALVALLLGIALLLLTRFAYRAIARPVQQLIEASERVIRGDYQLPLAVAAQNELGALAGTFQHMTQALRREGEEFAALKRFSEAVTQCTTENEVYDHILYSLQERFHPRQVMIFKLRPEEDLLESVATLVPLPGALRSLPVMEGKDSCKAVRMGRPFRVNDAATEPLCPGRFALPKEGSYFCAPLIANGIIIGAVRLEGVEGLWTPERESLLESYLSGAASVLSNLRLLHTMREQANIDPLTALYNRRFCEDYARKLMALARRKETPLGFIMMDLDHFKSFNDIYGHEVGDRILRQFAKTVTQTMRETNLTARFGGEEFVVLLPDTGPEACLVVAERIRKAVAHMAVPSGTDKPLPQITVSLGIAAYPNHGATLDEVLLAADRALYDSKRAGRNRTTIYVEEAEPAG